MNPRVVALAGNPNSGKTTLFNALTGLNQRVGNYPGITVERKWGETNLDGLTTMVVDLPGTYSLISRSREEAIAFQVLTGREKPAPELIVLVVDGSNLERNLYLALQVMELGRPVVVALNMIDAAEKRGLALDTQRMSALLGVPVLPVIASKGTGIHELRQAIAQALRDPKAPPPRRWRLDPTGEAALEAVGAALPDRSNGVPADREGEASWLLATLAATEQIRGSEDDPLRGSGDWNAALEVAEAQLKAGGAAAFATTLIEARYNTAAEIVRETQKTVKTIGPTATDRVDAILLHRVFGPLVFLLVVGLIFEGIFAWAQPVMSAIDDFFQSTATAVHLALPLGPLNDLLTQGAIRGVGSVLVFIPQIAILFAAMAVLEDSGYLARAAYIMDRVMARVGLHGRAFVPLISGFACAIPAIMSARTIESTKDRLVTIMVTPLMSCSARLPVYALIISALFANTLPIFGFISVGVILMLSMYLLSVTFTVLAAFLLKRTLLKSPTPPLVLELPPYRMPQLSNVLRRVFERCRVFVTDAGTVILACSIILWALLSYPREPLPFDPLARAAAISRALPGDQFAAKREEALSKLDAAIGAERLKDSFAGRAGRFIEPALKPLGFDWKIGIGLIGSFAAREVMVSTLGLVYGIGRVDTKGENLPLREALQKELDPATGKPLYTPLVGLSLMIFFLLACQCMSTLAVVRRETASLRWPALMFFSMTAMAWCGSFLVYQGGRLLGLG